MSSWDESGYALDDPKHPVNAGASKGLSESLCARPEAASRNPYRCENPEQAYIEMCEEASNE